MTTLRMLWRWRPELLLALAFWVLMMISFLVSLELYQAQRALEQCRMMHSIMEDLQ